MKVPTRAELARVAVVGTSCSGKTTFARHLSKILEVPHIELDALHWGENWQARPPAEFHVLVEQAVSDERWVADGNHGTVRELVWSRATAVVWLHYPFPLVFSRALWRTVRRIVTGQKIYSGNRESFRMAFLSRDSILLWVISSHWRWTRECRKLKASGRFPEVRFVQFSRPSQTLRFLSQVEAAA